MSARLFVGKFNKIYNPGNLSFRLDSESLREKFSEIGDVVDAFVVTDRDSGRSRGFGFVTFSDPAMASSALDILNDSDIDGRMIRLEYASGTIHV
ncbi:RNA-binding domain-containing protein [Rozella allomycis CSF55]|uniref:Nucleotide-binding, alpha-beta plait domain-containing protein n=1 Tax=Rozella allomycis (strain CSF55) TaxID=988480 RepID=A0A075AUK2_ROZAC|nr:Nucleotide-binding, alpha-beta plait domain-containing protein [Rozella allomycis CSF55]RKP19969.1 RNA-binding domain-containing protein [Rozella allomycis CSF55]|eukprot:EPZ33840.1 Nucleotide-binding, alpha-beta plait domain-containing protein [Rozella allomycis CSF55]